MKTIGLCMIVKDEAQVILRCLDSIRPLIDYVLVEDTGSTDGTQQIIRDYLQREGLPGEVFEAPWRDFAHNRSLALARLRDNESIDYAFVIDADDLFVPDLGFDPAAFKQNLSLGHYGVLVQDGPVTYYRPQICNNRRDYRYRGVVHEFLAAPPGCSGGTATGFHIASRREGARSRDPDKYRKDAQLLERALEADEDPSLRARYTFYLAQSYRDAGQTAEAAETFAKRAGMGDWGEEAWYARLQEARCRRRLGDEGGFLSAALAAFDQRPHRAEPLYDLANFNREHGRHATSVLFAEAGLALPRPDKDILFIEDFVYTTGLFEEYSISAFYMNDPVRRARGFAACNWLALNRETPARTRDLARSNLFFYLEPVRQLLPSFAARQIPFTPPAGYHLMNPSIARSGKQLVMVQRSVNSIVNDGRYETRNGEPFDTRNFLLRLSDDLQIESASEILPPADMPEPKFPQVRGFEDMRLFAWKGGLWCNAMCRELTPEGWCEQVLARIDEQPDGYRLADWRVLRLPGAPRHEKNWMPQVDGDQLRFIYMCDPTRIIDHAARPILQTTPAIAADQFRGGSQAIRFHNGWLTLIHEVQVRDGLRHYQHRFVWFDQANRLRGSSLPFFFHERGIEYSPGLAWHPDGKNLLISYGVRDGEAWLASVEAEEVRRAILEVERLPVGFPPAASPGSVPVRHQGDNAKKPAGGVGARSRERNKTAAGRTAAADRQARTKSAGISRVRRDQSRPPVFLHASWRTSSTWFWSKFRELPETLCYYEPYHTANATVTRDQAVQWNSNSWPSGHPPLAPYWREYLPLIRKSGGIRLFDRAIPFTWFVPLGGLHGELRPGEKRYLALLVRHAQRAGKVAVLGLNGSLGRIWPMKNACGGIHIFQYRNLWNQWLSYMTYKQKNDPYFYQSTAFFINRDDDPLRDCFVERAKAANQAPGKSRIDLLLLLSQADTFALFMAFHIYLYLHATLTAEMAVDVTKMARDDGYRAGVEAQLAACSGLAVSFADVREERHSARLELELDAIDWDQVREHGRRAAEHLSGFAPRKMLNSRAAEWIDAAYAEMERFRQPKLAAIPSGAARREAIR